MRDRAADGEKFLLANPFLITQLCLAVGIQELPSIDELIEATKTINLGLIKDSGNLLDKEARRGADMLNEMYRQSGQTKTTKDAEIAGYIDTI